MGWESGEQDLGMAEFRVWTRMRAVDVGLDVARNAELMGLKKAMKQWRSPLMV